MGKTGFPGLEEVHSGRWDRGVLHAIKQPAHGVAVRSLLPGCCIGYEYAKSLLREGKNRSSTKRK
jgi:hypothetical protein